MVTVEPLLNSQPYLAASNRRPDEGFSTVFTPIKQSAPFQADTIHFPEGGRLIGVELYLILYHFFFYFTLVLNRSLLLGSCCIVFLVVGTFSLAS